MTRPPPTREDFERYLKVERSSLTRLQDSLSKINAQIDAEDEDSEGRYDMKQARSQILLDIALTEEEIADYVEQLSALPIPNEDATVDYDRIESYLDEAQRDLAYAKGQETGSSYEAVNLHNAYAALQNAISALGRELPPSP